MNLKIRVMKMIKMIFCVCCLGTKERPSLCKYVSCDHLRVYFDLTRPKEVSKMSDLFKNTFRYILLRMLKYIPWTQEMCNDVVHIEPRSLAFVTDHFKTEEMCNQAVRRTHTP